MTHAPARLTHKPSLRGGVLLRVLPGDGRYPEEFRVDEAELRRFAWAVLADLAPDEARAAAAEDGVDLEAAGAYGPVAGVGPRPRPYSGRVNRPHAKANAIIAYGELAHRILAAMVRFGGPLTGASLTAHCARSGGRMSDAFRTLEQRGFVERIGLTAPGRTITWILTDAGMGEAARLGPLGEQRKAA